MKKWWLVLCIVLTVTVLFGCGEDRTLLSIEIHPSDASIDYVTNLQLTAKAIYSDGTTRDVTALASWSSSNTTIATMSNTTGSIGIATPVAMGKTTITATVGQISGSTSLTVVPVGAASPLSLTGTVSTLATGIFTQWGIATDGTFLYVANGDSSLRKIEIATGVVTSIASGLPGAYGITTDGKNLYTANDDNTISKIVIATGAVTQLASGLNFNGQVGIATDGAYIYSGSRFSGDTIYKTEIATGIVTPFVSDPNFNGPVGITTDGKNLYVVHNGYISKIVIATGVITHVTSGLGSTWGITTDGTYIYAASAEGFVSKIAISSGQILPVAGGLDMPGGITTDGISLYVACGDVTVRKIQ